MFEFITNSLDVAFSPILLLPTFWAVIILSLLISLITTLIYKYATNQQLMKDLKGEIKTLQEQAKTLKDKPTEAMDVQKKAMEANMKYMSHSMKPTLITFLPIILIFGWMTAHFAYDSISPQQEFSITISFQEGIKGNITAIIPTEITLTGKTIKEITNGQTIYTMKAKEGLHKLQFSINGKKYDKEVLVSTKNKYSTPETVVNDDTVKTITTSNTPKIVMNLLGWKLGWLGTYIIFSIIFSMLLRKWMRVY